MFEGRVAGVSDDEGTKDRADTSSGPSNSHGGSTGTDELGGGVNVSVDLQQWIVSKDIQFPFTMSVCNKTHRAGLETPDGGGGWLGHPGQGESGGCDTGEGRHGAGLGGLK